MAGKPSGPHTVREALADYFVERDRRVSKSVWADRYAAEARIIPTLGTVEVRKLTTKMVRDWLTKTEKAPKLLRTGKGAKV